MKHVIDTPLSVAFHFTVSEPEVTIKKSPWHRNWRIYMKLAHQSIKDLKQLYELADDIRELVDHIREIFRINLRHGQRAL